MRIALLVILFFFARMLVSAWFYSGQDNDLGWQSWLGSQVLAAHHIPTRLGNETFTSSGSPWVAQEWLFGTAVAWSYAHAKFWILALATALAAGGALFLTALRAKRRNATTIAIALATACTGFAMLQAFGVRAQIFGWLCLALLMLVLDSEGAWIYCAIPIVAVWANLHASAMLGPVLVSAWAFGTWVEDRAWTPRVARNVFVAAGCMLAVCMTPLLGELPRYALMLQTSPVRGTIAEWQPSDITEIAMYAGVLPLVCACIYFGIAAPRERWRDGMLFAVTVPMAFMAIRHMPICALTIAPMAAQRLSSVLGPYVRINVILREAPVQLLATACSIVCAVVIVIDLLHVPSVSGVTIPRTAMAKLSAVPGKHNLYCEDFAWCSLALTEPNLRTFVDGRCDPFPKDVWEDYIAVSRLHPDWMQLLQHYGVTAVMAKPGNPLAQAMASARGWHTFYRDSRYQIFLRNAQIGARG